MFAILIVAVSLLTQAHIFRDVENWESNVEADMLEADRSSAESDSSRDDGKKEGR